MPADLIASDNRDISFTVQFVVLLATLAETAEDGDQTGAKEDEESRQP